MAPVRIAREHRPAVLELLDAASEMARAIQVQLGPAHDCHCDTHLAVRDWQELLKRHREVIEELRQE